MLQIELKTTLLLAAFLLFLFLLSRFFAPPQREGSIPFSKPQFLAKTTWKITLLSYPKRLHLFAFLFLCLAFVNPHQSTEWSDKGENPKKRVEIPKEGIAIYLVLDRSGSMNGSASGKSTGQSKMETLKKMTEAFINNHPNDLLGLLYFARVPVVVAPLTLDHPLLIDQIKKLHVVEREEDDGTGIGYAIYKTARMIAATDYYSESFKKGRGSPYLIKNRVIIVVTDGFQDPNSLDQGNRLRTIDLQEAADYAKSQKIRLYLLNVDHAFGSEKYAPHRRLMKKITEETGGAFYLVNENESLEELYAKIDQIEKSPIQEKKITNEAKSYRKTSFAPLFLAIGLVLFSAAFFIELYLLKKVP